MKIYKVQDTFEMWAGRDIENINCKDTKINETMLDLVKKKAFRCRVVKKKWLENIMETEFFNFFFYSSLINSF